MGKNRTLGSPLEILVVDKDTQTIPATDVYLVNTTVGPITITLDPFAIEGDQYVVSDSGNDAATNNITIVGGGHPILDSPSTKISTNGGSLRLVFSSSLGGWQILSATQGGVSTAGSSSLVFRPGAVGPLPANVYTTWANTKAAAFALAGLRDIEFDDQDDPGGCIIDSSADFGNQWDVTFSSHVFTTVTVNAGVTLRGVSDFDGVQMVFNGNASCIGVTTGDVVLFRLYREATITSAGLGDFINTNGTGVSNVQLLDNTELVSGPCIGTTGAASTCGVFVFDQAIIQSNTLSAASAPTLQVTPVSPSASALLQTGQSGMPGGILVPQSVELFVNGDVVTQRPGNASFVRSGQETDFTSPDGAPHVAFTIPISAGTPNAVHNFDLVVQGKNATDSYTSKVNVTAQNAGGVVTALAGVVPVSQSNTGGGAWTATETISGTDIISTITAAAGVKWSCTRQDVVGA